jgi:hypothetical protein
VIVRPNVPEDGPTRRKHVVKGENVWCICTMNYVDGNNNKTMLCLFFYCETWYRLKMFKKRLLRRIF